MVKFVVVVKLLVKLKHCWIVTKIGLVVNIDYPIMVEVCGKMCGKIEKLSDWNKNWCGRIY